MKQSRSAVVDTLTWLMLRLLAANLLSAQKPQDTELYLDAVPADSVRCGGLTFQFAKFTKDMGHHPLAGQTIEGSEKTTIDIWIWNRTDSARTYDPHMLSAVNDEGNQLGFWSADETYGGSPPSRLSPACASAT